MQMSDNTETKIPESMYRILVENSKEAITIISGSKIVYANTVTARLCGYEKPEEIIDKDAFGFVSPRFRDQFTKRITSRLNGEPQPDRFDHELVKRDGSIVQVETNASLITYGARAPPQICGPAWFSGDNNRCFRCYAFCYHRCDGF